MSSIVTLSGRRIDARDASVIRFPEESIGRVGHAIEMELRKCAASWLVSSAAAGSDLIGLQVAIRLGLSCRIIIFGSVAEFRSASVSDRGYEWERMFDSVVNSIGVSCLTIVPSSNSQTQSFRAVNERIFTEALSLRSAHQGQQVISLAVWDEKRKTSDDFTAEYVDAAARLGIPVISISSAVAD